MTLAIRIASEKQPRLFGKGVRTQHRTSQYSLPMSDNLEREERRRRRYFSKDDRKQQQIRELQRRANQRNEESPTSARYWDGRRREKRMIVLNMKTAILAMS